ncbi:hypothetical protein IDG49_00870 [Pelagibacterales bacterium SAG-MED07]|nr:hypothetical protein [Pelagibacterales bacterium SAG-MED07]
MLKFIVPAIIFFLVVIFWDKICELIYKKLNIKLNYLIISIVLLLSGIIILLLND